MLYLLWSILNTFVLCYFIYLLIGFLAIGKRVFHPKFKTISICILLMGVLQLMHATTTQKPKNTIRFENKRAPNSDTQRKEFILEDNLTFSITMDIFYSANNKNLTPIQSSSAVNGFISGYTWEYKSISTHQVSENEPVNYTAKGNLKWQLLGFTIYSEAKNFTGIID